MKRSHKIILAFSVAIILGLYSHFANPFEFAVLIFLYLFSILFSLINLITDLFNKQIRIRYLVGFIPILVTYLTLEITRNYKHQKAVSIISNIENYKNKTGKYPGSLLKLGNTIRIKGLIYSTNPDQTTYHLEYLMDGFNREYYESESEKWGSLGWND